LGGSLDGQWLEPCQFEAKLDGEIVDTRLINDCDKVELELTLVKKGQSINFYNNDGCSGNGTCEQIFFFVDGYGNRIYYTDMDTKCEIENSTIGIGATWNPCPLPDQVGEVSDDRYIIDIDNDGKIERLLVSRHKKDEEITIHTLTLEMDKKSIPLAELWIDEIYSCRYNITFLDLNGDGQLEIIIATEGHNLSLDIYDIVDGEAQTAISLYIGD
jgi:hypothetical protein